MARELDPDAPLPPEGDSGQFDQVDADLPPEPPEPQEPEPVPAAVADASPPPTENSAGSAAASAEPPPPAIQLTAVVQAPPQIIDFGPAGGSYEVVRPLGEGGMAKVLLARRRGVAGFERLVALKCVLDALAYHDGFCRMAVSEAKLASRLHHRNIAAIYDLQQHGDTYYMVMEYVAGVTVRAALQLAAKKHRVFSEAFAVYVGAEIADALHYAHALRDEEGRPLGIVHRDITPSNAMLGTAGDVKILDFGIAFSRLRDREKTMTDMFKGKFAYLSPEQARGTEELDGRSDIYGLGLVLAEMLTGRKVFAEGTDYEIIQTIGDGDASVTEQAIAELSPGLKDILRRALAPDRAERFQNGAEFAHALRAYAAGSGLVVGPVDCVRELESLRELPDLPEEDRRDTPERERLASPAAPAPRTAAPALNGGKAASPAGAGGGEASTAARRLEQIREKLRNPQNPTRRLAVFGVVVFVVLLLGNWIASVFFRSPGKAGVEVVETEAQRRARAEVEMKEAGPAQPVAPVLAQPPVEAALLVGPNARRGPAAQGWRTSPASVGTPDPAAMADAAPARFRHRVQRTAAREDPEPRFRRRTFGTSTRTSFVDAPSASRGAAGGQGTARMALPPGILIPARLLIPADPGAPGPVSAEVTRDVSADGAIVVPRGSTILCSSQSLNAARRVPLACNALVIGGAARTFSGTAMGGDKRPGLPTAVTGGSSTRDSARTGALETAESVASELAGGADGVAGALSRGAIRTGGGAARAATAPGTATAEAVPAGTPFFVFVQQSGGLL